MASVLYKQANVGNLKLTIIQDSSTGTTSTFTLSNKPNVYGIDVVNLTATRAVQTGYVQSTGVVTIGGLTGSDSIYYTIITD